MAYLEDMGMHFRTSSRHGEEHSESEEILFFWRTCPLREVLCEDLEVGVDFSS